MRRRSSTNSWRACRSPRRRRSSSSARRGSRPACRCRATTPIANAICSSASPRRIRGPRSTGSRRPWGGSPEMEPRNLRPPEPLLFEVARRGRRGYEPPAMDIPDAGRYDLDPRHVRNDIEGFPELSEVDVVRHYTRISRLNYAIDMGLYPLGSCTMKYNPKVNERVARLPGFADA